MLATIELDGDKSLEADEVEDVRAERPLATELVAIEASGAEVTPEVRFGFGRVFAECAGEAVHVARVNLPYGVITSILTTYTCIP
jgi:hypothetical protein